KSAMDGYFNPAYDTSKPNPFSPYIPDATGFSINGHVTGIVGEFSFSFGVAFDQQHNGVFHYGYDSSWGFSPELPSLGISAQYNMYDNYGDNTDVLGGIAGKDITYSGGLLLQGGYSETADFVNGNYTPAASGVSTKSIGLGPGWGARKGISTSDIIRF
ncbi:hypothetical protein CHU92_00115, partial [Flavobacterium cyanobacteriorum]